MTELARQAPRFATLNEWLAWQEQLHPNAIELGLDRVRKVLERLVPAHPDYPIITVGGTNGKGSTVAFLEAMLRAAGYRVGAYFSPHILRYNERIRIDGREVDDAQLCAAFERVDAARGDVSLTYFEFGTLAAFDLFHRHGIGVALLEVGLGGRLDAVNVLDADCAVVTTVDLDHCDWLGPDRESIGFEKAGIYRTGRPAICADPRPPESLLDQVRRLGACLYRFEVDYHYLRNADCWDWRGPGRRFDRLPLPILGGAHQMTNAATALMALDCLRDRLTLDRRALDVGLIAARLPGRFQVLPGPVEWIYDVAHNPQAARTLVAALKVRPVSGRTLMVLAMLRDKDCGAVARELNGAIDIWYPTGLSGPRGRSGAELADDLMSAGIAGIIRVADDVAAACAAAATDARPGDRIVVCGSFHTVAGALRSAQLEEVDCG